MGGFLLNLMKKAISAGTSAALLASLLATAVAPSALAVGTITNIVYQANGADAGSVVAPAPLAAFASFNPSDALQSGTNLTLTLPAGTTVSATCTAANFTVRQTPQAAVAPSGIVVAGNTISFNLPVAAIGTTGAGVTIAYATNAAPVCVITNPTNATGPFNLTVAIQGNGSASLPVTFVAGPPTILTLSPLTPTVPWGTSLQFVATCTDANLNAQTCPATTWTAVTLAAGTGTISTNGLFAATGVGTVTVTANAGAGALTQATVATVTAVPASVSCTPSGGTLASGNTVSCVYNQGSTGTTVAWAGSNFTPASSATLTQIFTAANLGAASVIGTITATPSVGGASATFTYAITPAPAVVIPPATPGTVTLSATKTVVRGGVAVDPVYTFTEGLAGDWLAGQHVTVCFADKNGVPLTVSGGKLAGPDSLGFVSSSYSVTSPCFTVTLGTSDTTRLEAFTVSDLMFKAGSTTAPGAIAATYTTNMGGNAAYFGGTSRTASGTLAAASTLGATQLLVNLDITSGVFKDTSGGNGNYKLNTGAANAESLTGTAGTLGGPGVGQQLLTTSIQANNHAFGEPVTQTILGLIGTVPSPGTIADSLTLDANSAPQLRVGVANQVPGTVTLAERDATNSSGLLAKGTVITLKIGEPGVLFSALPTYVVTGSLTLGTGVLSLDRTSATFAVTAADASASVFSSITFAMKYDVATTAKTGDAVELAVTAGTIATVTSPVTNAYIGSLIFVTSTAPTVYINENDQLMGKAVMTEVAAASIGSAAGGNTLYACLNTGETWTRAPWLVRTAGDIMITNPDLLVGATSARGTAVSVYPYYNCYAWAVYTASTVASTLEIQGVDAAGAATPTARISVPTGLTPGPVYLSIGTMASLTATSGNLLDIATVAIRAFRSGIVVTAAAQPFIMPGAQSAPAGNITIAETGHNLLVAGETIYCTIRTRTNQPSTQDTLLANSNQNNRPIVSTNGATTGLQASLSYMSPTAFWISVDQAATAGLGMITVSNLLYNTSADAPNGPVQVECSNSSTQHNYYSAAGTIGAPSASQIGGQAADLPAGAIACLYINVTDGVFAPWNATIDYGYFNQEDVTLYPPLASATCAPAGSGRQVFTVVTTYAHSYGASVDQYQVSDSSALGAPFDAFVSNAIIGSARAINIAAVSALGVNPTSGYTTKTPKVAALGKFITWKFTGGAALANQRVNVLVAYRINGAWGGPKYLVSRTADANGIVTFTLSSKTASVLNIRVQWPGSATHGVSTSKALGAHWQ